MKRVPSFTNVDGVDGFAPSTCSKDAAASSQESPSKKLFKQFHGLVSSSAASEEGAQGSTLTMKLIKVGGNVQLTFSVPKNLLSVFLSEMCSWVKIEFAQTFGSDFLRNKKDARIDGQFFSVKDCGAISAVSLKVPSKFNYLSLRQRASEIREFFFVDADNGSVLDALLIPNLMLELIIHVYPRRYNGENELRIAFSGVAGFSLKPEIREKVFAKFGSQMRYDGELWCNVPGEDLDFEKIQAISDYVLTLGANYKKNITKLSEEMLSLIPEFLANVHSV